MSSLEKNKIDIHDYVIIPNEISLIQSKVQSFADHKIPLVILTVGTGAVKKRCYPRGNQTVINPGNSGNCRNNA